MDCCVKSLSPSGGMVKGNVRFWPREVFAPSPFLLVGTSPCSSQSFLRPDVRVNSIVGLTIK